MTRKRNPGEIGMWIKRNSSANDANPLAAVLSVQIPVLGMLPALDGLSLAMYTIADLAEVAVRTSDLDAMEMAGLRWAAVINLADQMLGVATEAKCLTRGNIRVLLPQLQHMTKGMRQCIDVAAARDAGVKLVVDSVLEGWGIK